VVRDGEKFFKNWSAPGVELGTTGLNSKPPPPPRSSRTNSDNNNQPFFAFSSTPTPAPRAAANHWSAPDRVWRTSGRGRSSSATGWAGATSSPPRTRIGCPPSTTGTCLGSRGRRRSKRTR